MSLSSSAASLPALAASFPINEECTSITVTSSGRIVIAGFADGTIRLFDRTGVFGSTSKTSVASSTSSSVTPSETDTNPSEDEAERGVTAEQEDEYEFDDGDTRATADDETRTERKVPKKSAAFVEVNSSDHQRFGAVAGQIYARGVHTALRLDCVVSDNDNEYVFASVLRGNMECVAIHIGPLESFLASKSQPPQNVSPEPPTHRNLLDYVHVHRHSDAKLRGLGACTRLINHHGGSDSSDSRPRYLLLTGKSIKNIHIWSFQPPRSNDDEPIWQCLYDCPTNGNTIQWLAFRRAVDDTAPTLNRLQAISKSLHQKLRVWDISQEEQITEQPITAEESQPRRNRPPYQDILNTECALGVAGNWIICGGELFDNQISIVSLENTLSQYPPSSTASLYNHTELALPASTTTAINANHTASSYATTAMTSNTDQRRQQRGDMKCVVSVSGIQNHVLLELSDGSVAEYCVSNSSGITMIPTIEKLPDPTCTRQLSVREIIDGTLSNTTQVIALIAAYQPIRGRGTITIQPLIPHIEPPKTERKVYSKEAHVTPIPLHSMFTVTETLASGKTGDSKPEPKGKVNIVTTTKKLKPNHDPPSQFNVSVRVPGEPALVTTAKKKLKSKKQKRIEEKNTDTTPYRIDCDIKAIPQKKQRTNVVLPISTSSDGPSKPTDVDPSSFSTPFPKNVVPTFNKDTNSTDSTDLITHNDNNDNYLATIYEKATFVLSSTKQRTLTPLSWHRDSSVETTTISETKTFGSITIPTNGIDQSDTVGGMLTAPIHKNEPSPPIPRKRSVPTVSGKPRRRESVSNIKGVCNITSTIPQSLTPCANRENATLQNVTKKIINSPPLTPNVTLNKISVEATTEVTGDCNNDKNPSKAIQEISPSTHAPGTNIRDRIIELCQEKLRELEIFEEQVNGNDSPSMVKHAQQRNTNPYTKQYRSMMTHHYTCHVQMRQRIIDATRATIYSIMDAPIASSLDKAKGFLYSALVSYQDLSNEMVQLQRVEAYTLLSLQKQQVTFGIHHTSSEHDANDDTEITFAFPTLFQDVMKFLPVLE